MAPKAKGGKGGKDGKGKDGQKEETSDAGPVATVNSALPQNKDEVLAQVNLEGLPHCPNEQIIEILKDKYENLVAVFVHYCKQSECKTLEQATRLRLGAPWPAPCAASRRAAAYISIRTLIVQRPALR